MSDFSVTQNFSFGSFWVEICPGTYLTLPKNLFPTLWNNIETLKHDFDISHETMIWCHENVTMKMLP